MIKEIKNFDPDLSRAIENEKTRQEQEIELIASENYVSPCILEAQGSVLTNKYAEGYPGKRYYGGCEHVDVVEQLAIDRVKELFGADYANVQPHSGSQANGAVFLALLEAGDTVMGMKVSEGGHFSHGAKFSFSGKTYNSVFYGVDSNCMLDYDAMRTNARKHKPKMIIGGFSAYSRTVDWTIMREIADEVGAYLLADMSHIAGLVAAGLHPNPLPHAHVVTSTTHKTLRGPRGGIILTKGQPEISKKINTAVFPGMQGGPLMHVIAAKAIAFKEALSEDFVEYQKQVIKNSATLANKIQQRGYKIVSGGTDNHLMMIDLTPQGLTGKQVYDVLSPAHITVNKYAIPNDPQPLLITSGIRVGSPACTTRGFKEAEFNQIGDWICDLIDNIEDESEITRVRSEVIELCNQYPVYTQELLPFAKVACG